MVDLKKKKSVKVILLLSSLFSEATSSQITWSTPQQLSTNLVNASNPEVVMDSSGNATVAWIENGVVMASSLPVNGNWGASEPISGSGASSLLLRIDSNGNVTALWLRTDVVEVATIPIGGSWSSPTALSSSGASSPTLSIDALGDIVVVWERGGYIESSSLPNGGVWSAVTQISGVGSTDPDVSIGNNGKIVAVWHTLSNTGNDIVQSASSQIGGAWGSPLSLSPYSRGYSMNYPKVSVDGNGNVALIYHEYSDLSSKYSNVTVCGAFMPLGSLSWGDPIQISSTSAGNPANLMLKIQHDSSGNAMALWTFTSDQSMYGISGALAPVGGPFGPQGGIDLSAYSFAFDSSVNTINNALTAYMSYDGINTVVKACESSLFAFGFMANFTPGISVSAVGNNAFPKVAYCYDGTDIRGAVAWIGSDGVTSGLNVSTGVRAPIAPAVNVTALQTSISFGVFTDYVNTISWNLSSCPKITQYVLLRNGIPLTFLDSSTNSFTDYNVAQGEAITYSVIVVDQDNTTSLPAVAELSFP